MRKQKKVRRRAALSRAVVAHPNTQTQVAVECGMDPAKLSRIINGLGTPTAEDRETLAGYLGKSERALFPKG